VRFANWFALLRESLSTAQAELPQINLDSPGGRNLEGAIESA